MNGKNNMKLRNKKTGEIIDTEYAIGLQITSTSGERTLLFKDLTDLNSLWEDYEPKEPLIKDEKIRKAVRAWAKANRTSKFEYDGLYGITDETVNEIEFGSSAPFAELEDDRYYTIEELCGIEECN